MRVPDDDCDDVPLVLVAEPPDPIARGEVRRRRMRRELAAYRARVGGERPPITFHHLPAEAAQVRDIHLHRAPAPEWPLGGVAAATGLLAALAWVLACLLGVT